MLASMEKVADYRGYEVLYCAKYDSWNVADGKGGFVIDGAGSLAEAKAWLDSALKPRRRDPRVGGVWDNCPLEYLSEMGGYDN